MKKVTAAVSMALAMSLMTGVVNASQLPRDIPTKRLPDRFAQVVGMPYVVNLEGKVNYVIKTETGPFNLDFGQNTHLSKLFEEAAKKHVQVRVRGLGVDQTTSSKLGKVLKVVGLEVLQSTRPRTEPPVKQPPAWGSTNPGNKPSTEAPKPSTEVPKPNGQKSPVIPDKRLDYTMQTSGTAQITTLEGKQQFVLITTGGKYNLIFGDNANLSKTFMEAANKKSVIRVAGQLLNQPSSSMIGKSIKVTKMEVVQSSPNSGAKPSTSWTLPNHPPVVKNDSKVSVPEKTEHVVTTNKNGEREQVITTRTLEKGTNLQMPKGEAIPVVGKAYVVSLEGKMQYLVKTDIGTFSLDFAGNKNLSDLFLSVAHQKASVKVYGQILNRPSSSMVGKVVKVIKLERVKETPVPRIEKQPPVQLH